MGKSKRRDKERTDAELQSVPSDRVPSSESDGSIPTAASPSSIAPHIEAGPYVPNPEDQPYEPDDEPQAHPSYSSSTVYGHTSTDLSGEALDRVPPLPSPGRGEHVVDEPVLQKYSWWNYLFWLSLVIAEILLLAASGYPKLGAVFPVYFIPSLGLCTWWASHRHMTSKDLMYRYYAVGFWIGTGIIVTMEWLFGTIFGNIFWRSCFDDNCKLGLVIYCFAVIGFFEEIIKYGMIYGAVRVQDRDPKASLMYALAAATGVGTGVSILWGFLFCSVANLTPVLSDSLRNSVLGDMDATTEMYSTSWESLGWALFFSTWFILPIHVLTGYYMAMKLAVRKWNPEAGVWSVGVFIPPILFRGVLMCFLLLLPVAGPSNLSFGSRRALLIALCFLLMLILLVLVRFVRKRLPAEDFSAKRQVAMGHAGGYGRFQDEDEADGARPYARPFREDEFDVHALPSSAISMSKFLADDDV